MNADFLLRLYFKISIASAGNKSGNITFHMDIVHLPSGFLLHDGIISSTENLWQYISKSI